MTKVEGFEQDDDSPVPDMPMMDVQRRARPGPRPLSNLKAHIISKAISRQGR